MVDTALSPTHESNEPAKLAHGAQWDAFHIFYGGDTDALVRQCVMPLIEELEASNYLARFFYISYWLEGGHVRLRLKAADESRREGMRTRSLAVISLYLAEHPSLHSMPELESSGYYESLFAAEYRGADRTPYFHEDGTPRFVPNNTVQQRFYAPEFERYGGPRGMVISEDFFEQSTRLVFTLRSFRNVGVRTMLLGSALEAMLVLAMVFLENRKDISDFFYAYYRRWVDLYEFDESYSDPTKQRAYASSKTRIGEMVDGLYANFHRDGLGSMPGYLGHWAHECGRIRELIEAAVAGGEIEFDLPDRGRFVAESNRTALWVLGHSFVHMTNNRLGLTAADEAYVAYLIATVLKDKADDVE